MALRSEARARIVFLAVACVLMAAGFAYRAAKHREPVTSVQFIMDTVVEQTAYGPNAQQAVMQAEALLREIEQEQSLFLSGSEVSAINQGAGVAPVAVSERTFEVLRLSVEYAQASGGDFDVTTAPLKELWSITGEAPQVPPQSELDALLPLVDYRGIVLDEANRTVFLKDAGQKLDLGGITKGYAAGQCLNLYRTLGVTGYLNVGGNIAVAGGGSAGDGLTVGIRAPRGEAGYFGSVTLADTVMATSGDYERYFEQDGVRYHHILDPKTGRPAQSGLTSVSVFCRDGALADFLSTTLFLRGRRGLDSLRGAYSYEYIAVDSHCNVIVSQGMQNTFRLNPDAAEYHLLS